MHKLPKNIEDICKRLEAGKPAWKLALEMEVQTPMIYHLYRWNRGYSLNDWKMGRQDESLERRN